MERQSGKQRLLVHSVESLDAFLPLVLHWANHFKKRPAYRYVDTGDLIHDGYLGLVRAAELFRPARKCQFSIYASKWIRACMRRLPSRMGLHAGAPFSPDYLDAWGKPSVDVLPSDKTNSTFEDVINAELRRTVSAALDALDDQARDVVAARFGLNGKEETRNQIADRRGISTSRVRRIERDALNRLRNNNVLGSYATGA